MKKTLGMLKISSRLAPVLMLFLVNSAAFSQEFCKDKRYLSPINEKWQRDYDVYLFEVKKSSPTYDIVSDIFIDLDTVTKHILKNYKRNFYCKSSFDMANFNRSGYGLPDIVTSCLRLDISYSFNPRDGVGLVVQEDGNVWRGNCKEGRGGCLLDKNENKYFLPSSSFDLSPTTVIFPSMDFPRLNILDDGSKDGRIRSTYWENLSIGTKKFVFFSYQIDSGYTCNFDSEGSNPNF